jgi:hypothetical protein
MKEHTVCDLSTCQTVQFQTRIYVFEDAVCSFPLECKDHESSTPEHWLPKSAYDGDMKQVMPPFFCGPRHCLGQMSAIIYFIDLGKRTMLRSIAA